MDLKELSATTSASTKCSKAAILTAAHIGLRLGLRVLHTPWGSEGVRGNFEAQKPGLMM